MLQERRAVDGCIDCPANDAGVALSGVKDAAAFVDYLSGDT
jgi:hypothetical protein